MKYTPIELDEDKKEKKKTEYKPIQLDGELEQQEQQSKQIKPTLLGIGAEAKGSVTLKEPTQKDKLINKFITTPDKPTFGGTVGISKPFNWSKLPDPAKNIIQLIGGVQGFRITEPELYKQSVDLKNEIYQYSDPLERIAKAHEMLTGETMEQALKEIKAYEPPDRDKESGWKPSWISWRGADPAVYGKGSVGMIKLSPKELPEKYQEALGLVRQASQFTTPELVGDTLQTASRIFLIANLAISGLKGIYQAGLRVEDKYVTGKKIEAALKRAQKYYDPKTGKFSSGISNNDLAIANRVRDIFKMTGGKIENLKNIPENIKRSWGINEQALGFKVPQKVFLGEKGYLNLAKIISQKGLTPEVTSQLEGLNNMSKLNVIKEAIQLKPELVSVFAKDIKNIEALIKAETPPTTEKPTEVPVKKQIEMNVEKPESVNPENPVFSQPAEQKITTIDRIAGTFDVEYPFKKMGAPETGFQVKNFFSNASLPQDQVIEKIHKLNKVDVNPVTSTEKGFKPSEKLDYADITFLSERPEYFVKLTPEEKKIASQARKINKDFYKEWEGKLKKEGLIEEPFPQSLITRETNKINGLRKQLKKTEDKDERNIIKAEIDRLEQRIQKVKDQKIQFVSVPIKAIFSNAETNPDSKVYERIMSILPKWDRETITVKDLVDAGVISRKEADIRYIMGEYADRVGKKYAINKIFSNAKKEGLIKPQAIKPDWLPPKVYINGRYTDIPQLRGMRLEPLFSDTITDLFSKDSLSLGPILGTIKMMQFYNPLMMPMYDIWQSAAAGTFLNPIKGAGYTYKGIKDVITKSDDYWRAYENGLFSKPYVIPYDKFENKFLEAMKGNKLEKFLTKAMLPTNWLSMIYAGSWNIAWTLDPMVRMMTFNYLKDKGWSDREAAQTAALFHGDYASVPVKTRRIANKVFFTPTFKIVMAKLYGEMLTSIPKIIMRDLSDNKKTNEYLELEEGKWEAKREKTLGKKQGVLARGALIALGIMMGIKFFFESQGYEEIEMFRKYTKEVETDEGIKENVITLSHPFNIPWRYYYRVKNAWKPQNLNVAEKLVDSAKWDLHPLWRTAYDIIKNSNYSIYNPFDESQDVAFDIGKYAFGEFIAISKSILESAEAGKVKAENFEALQKDMGQLKAIILKPFIYNYLGDTKETRAMIAIKGLRKEFERLQFIKISRDEEINYKNIENLVRRMESIQQEIESIEETTKGIPFGKKKESEYTPIELDEYKPIEVKEKSEYIPIELD